MTVRIASRMSKLFRNPLLEFLGDEVLEPFSLIVQFIHGIAEHLEKKRLDQTMMAHDLERPAATG